MFPDYVDATKLVPDKTRAGHWLYPPTGDVFHAPSFTPLAAAAPVIVPPKTDPPPPVKETLSPPPQARSEEPADE